MKLFSEFVEALANDKQPMYVAVRPDVDAIDVLRKIIRQYGVPNPIPNEGMHCTLIYSRTPTVIPQVQNLRIYKGTLEKFTVFNSRDGKRCLVAKIDSIDLLARHNELMTELDASYDFPEYLPHVTLSYDIGEFDESILNEVLIKTPIYFTDEYYEILDDLKGSP